MDIFLTIEEALSSAEERILIGIIGEPGSGKSTLTEKIRERFPTRELAIVSMDGYHLSNKILNERGIRNVKGAPQTFDALGFTELLRRIKTTTQETIFYPIFHREIEESIAAEGEITPEVKVVVVEGNYLLHPHDGWGGVSELLDKSFYIDLPDEIRIHRLILRHAKYGKTLDEAKSWALGSDEANASIIRLGKSGATEIISGS